MNPMILPYAQPTTPDLRPETSDKTSAKITFYARKDQTHILNDICLGIERANRGSTGKVDLSMLGRALMEIGIDMAFGINPINLKETPQAALLRRIQDEILTKRND